MTEKKKGLITRMLFAVVILLLISFCFLGNTFARYTSTGEGKASVSVAKWDVAVTPATGETAEFSGFVPSADAYGDTVRTTARTNTSDKLVLVATIVNSGDVDATVTLSPTNVAEIYLAESTEMSDTVTTVDKKTITKTQVQALFSMTVYVSETEITDLKQIPSTAYDGTAITVAKTNGKAYIYATVTWTSDDLQKDGESLEVAALETRADELDTWVGQNVHHVEYTINFKAVQASV